MPPDAMSKGLDAIYRSLGVPCVYAPASGPSIVVTATVTFDLATVGDRDQMQGVRALVSVRRSEIPHEPKSGDRYTVDGREYVVTRIHEASELEHTAAVA